VGETLDQTRVEIAAQRTLVADTVERLKARGRRAVDVRAKVRENPALFAAVGAGAVFLLAGGPMRVARLARRRLMRTRPEKAYDSLPGPMQAWVDSLAGSVGPKAERARETLAGELLAWRQAPLRDKKARKELAKQMVEGPPGPGRTTWKAFEAAAAIISAALARRAVERFLSGEPPALESRSNAGLGAQPPSETRRAASVVSGYSSISAGSRARQS
jgi:hypothetical protein